MKRLRDQQCAQAMRHGKGVAVARLEQGCKAAKHCRHSPGADAAGDDAGRAGQCQALQGEDLAETRAEQHDRHGVYRLGKATRLGNDPRFDHQPGKPCRSGAKQACPYNRRKVVSTSGTASGANRRKNSAAPKLDSTLATNSPRASASDRSPMPNPKVHMATAAAVIADGEAEASFCLVRVDGQCVPRHGVAAAREPPALETHHLAADALSVIDARTRGVAHLSAAELRLKRLAEIERHLAGGGGDGAADGRHGVVESGMRIGGGRCADKDRGKRESAKFIHDSAPLCCRRTAAFPANERCRRDRNAPDPSRRHHRRSRD